MSSAFGEPPDSGVKASAPAVGARNSSARIPATRASRAILLRHAALVTAKGRESYPRAGRCGGALPDFVTAVSKLPFLDRASPALEGGLPLLGERPDPLEEVLAASQVVL